MTFVLSFFLFLFLMIFFFFVFFLILTSSFFFGLVSLSIQDFSHTSMVSKTRLNALLKLAPSFEELVSFPAILMSKPWFIGYLSKSEATMLLQQEPLDTFIVRLHKNNRGTLACSYTSNRGVQHSVIVRDKFGYTMLKSAGTFASLDELISHNPFLKHELAQPWVRSNTFLGESTKEEAEQMLEGLNEGVYVIRLQITPVSSSSPPLSSSSNALATAPPSTTHTFRETSFIVSVNTSAGSIRHLLIPTTLDGNVVVGGKSYSSITSYLESHKATFSMPFSPSLPRFRSRLDSKVSPNSPSTSSGTRFSQNLNLSGSSLSLSSSVGIPRSVSSGSSFSSPNISQDDLALTSSLAGISMAQHLVDDELPIIDVLLTPTRSKSPRNTKSPWKPLTYDQVNPLNITYKDMWAELLRYYHVPVPEAKIPPKTMERR
jgi:hypothetical protein